MLQDNIETTLLVTGAPVSACIDNGEILIDQKSELSKQVVNILYK